MTFESDMRKAEKKIHEAAEKAIRAAALDIFSEIVRRTPVGAPEIWKSEAPEGYIGGTLRNNWQASVGSPRLFSAKEADKSGAASINSAKTAVGNYRLSNESIYFANNLPYAERVEDGWSTQRPNGMVKVTVKQFKPVIEKIARRFKV